MTLNEPRLRAALDAAMNEITSTVAGVAERVSQHEGPSVPSGLPSGDRESMTAALLELRSQLSRFRLTFADGLRAHVARELSPRSDIGRPLANTDWRSLTLVEDSEMEDRMLSDRIAQAISHSCEAELRELAGYMASLLHAGHADPDRNPLRPETLGEVLYSAIGAVSAQSEARRLLARALGQAAAKAMPACYEQITIGLQARGIAPAELGVRGVEGPGNQLPGVTSGYDSLTSLRNAHLDPHTLGADPNSEYAAVTGRGPSTLYGSAMPASGSRGAASRSAAASSAGDAQLMALLRRLTVVPSQPGVLEPGSAPTDATAFASSALGGASGLMANAGDETPADHGLAADPLTGLMAVNLIRAHRDELRRASTGNLDHMVIDVVGSLFDQILSDSRVPPHMARQIARLQLPVLRVALSDSSFFSSRRHPVRPFVNRIASLACAFDDFDEDPGRQFLTRVRQLVQEIVDGDFDQIELYAAKLGALEGFIAEQAVAQAPQQAAIDTLHTKEAELRLQQRYTLQLQRALSTLSLPPYLRHFLPEVWSQALVLAATREGKGSERLQRYRRVGRDLVMSVQPKGSPALRKKFLMQLPALMRDLNEGLKLIGWPAAAQRDFFGKLLPAHAESLKGQPLTELDHNMMVKQLEAVFGAPVPGADSLSAADEVPEVDAEVLARRFSTEEASRVGLLDENAVDWAHHVDIELEDQEPAEPQGDSGTDPDDSSAAGLGLGLGLSLDLNLDLATPEPPEPSRGPQLMDHINLGFAYQMLLKDEWQKVRLAHVSAGRSFFVFTRGRKHLETISMTARMLARMCETGRMRAVESAYLLERATSRARKQLAALKAVTQH